MRDHRDIADSGHAVREVWVILGGTVTGSGYSVQLCLGGDVQAVMVKRIDSEWCWWSPQALSWLPVSADPSAEDIIQLAAAEAARHGVMPDGSPIETR